MGLYEDWIREAYDKDGTSIKKHWDVYMPIEQKIYEKIISEKINHISGTIKELGARFHVSPEYFCGFLDGINEALDEKLDMQRLGIDDFISININFEMLYKKMVEYKAEHLYTLPEWSSIFSEDKQKELYYEQKKSKTVINENKVGRNELCICGSGKKYKKCCGVE